MKTVLEMFADCSGAIGAEFGDADASERLRASLALVELTMRGIAEEFNQKRWEESQKNIPHYAGQQKQV